MTGENTRIPMIDQPTEQQANAQEKAARDEAMRKFGEEALKDPKVALIVQRYRDISQVVNQVGAWLNGHAQVNPDVNNEERVKWLATRYCMDVIFLLEQLGVVEIQEQQQTKSDEKNVQQQEQTTTEEFDESEEELV